jgi:hypothetical protein
VGVAPAPGGESPRRAFARARRLRACWGRTPACASSVGASRRGGARGSPWAEPLRRPGVRQRQRGWPRATTEVARSGPLPWRQRDRLRRGRRRDVRDGRRRGRRNGGGRRLRGNRRGDVGGDRSRGRRVRTGVARDPAHEGEHEDEATERGHAAEDEHLATARRLVALADPHDGGRRLHHRAPFFEDLARRKLIRGRRCRRGLGVGVEGGLGGRRDNRIWRRWLELQGGRHGDHGRHERRWRGWGWGRSRRSRRRRAPRVRQGEGIESGTDGRRGGRAAVGGFEERVGPELEYFGHGGTDPRCDQDVLVRRVGRGRWRRRRRSLDPRGRGDRQRGRARRGRGLHRHLGLEGLTARLHALGDRALGECGGGRDGRQPQARCLSQLSRHHRGVGPALVWRQAERACRDLDEVLRPRSARRDGGSRNLAAVHAGSRHERIGVREQRLAAKRLPEERPGAVHVGALIIGPAGQDLGRHRADGPGVGKHAGVAARDGMQNAGDAVEPEDDRRRRELAVRELQGLLTCVAKVVQGRDAREDVDEHAERDLERQPACGVVRAPERGELLAIDELRVRHEVFAAHRDVAHARQVRTGERGDALRLAQEVRILAVRAQGGPREALRHEEVDLRSGRRGLAHGVGVRGPRAELPNELVGREGSLGNRQGGAQRHDNLQIITARAGAGRPPAGAHTHRPAAGSGGPLQPQARRGAGVQGPQGRYGAGRSRKARGRSAARLCVLLAVTRPAGSSATRTIFMSRANSEST